MVKIPDKATSINLKKLATLRFNLARICYEQAKNMNRVLTPEEFVNLNPELKIQLYRNSLEGNIHLEYMNLRKKIYNEVKWVNPNWDEEIMSYKEHGIYSFDEVFSFIDNIDLSKKSPEIAQILNPILKKRLENEKYNFKNYMKQNWNK